ncbi:MAG: hypothetical protein OES69_19495, partial [Myxococcales bacterium]|nr:hypothetical protein [Myxococcales bacterium]
WTFAGNRDLVSSMCRWWLLGALLLAGCEGRQEARVVLPDVEPSEVVVSWGMVGRDGSRDTMYMELLGDRRMAITTKRPNGNMVQVQRELSKDQYADLIDQLRKLDCCSLESRSKTAPSPLESQPELAINFGDVECQIALWDSEWRLGRARECGFAVAQVHGGGFLPDPPAADPAR